MFHMWDPSLGTGWWWIFGRVCPQNDGAQAVDGADAGGIEGAKSLLPALPVGGGTLRQPAGDFGSNAVAHLAGGFIGEGDGQQRAQRQAGLQQGQVAPDQRPGFAGPRPGCDRDGHFAAGRGGALVGGEGEEGEDGRGSVSHHFCNQICRSRETYSKIETPFLDIVPNPDEPEPKKIK